MLHTIENERLICTIESKGAEIRSLKNKITEEEYIWKIDDTVWGSSSPILFPAIGKIKGDKVLLNGKAYAMPKHGIIRNNEALTFERHSASKCLFTLKSSAVTLKQYPYDFAFAVEYTLIDKQLIMNYEIENKGNVPMTFACGGHTAYACPLDDDTNLSDYVIEFPIALKLESELVGTSGLLVGGTRAIDCDNEVLPLSNTLFDKDALVFSDIACEWVRLRKKDEKKGIIVRFSGYPHLALWSKPSADFVCIEPWLGLTDREDESLDLAQKRTYKTIAPNSTFCLAIETIVE